MNGPILNQYAKRRMFLGLAFTALGAVVIGLSCAKDNTRFSTSNTNGGRNTGSAGEDFGGLKVAVPVQLRGVDKSAWVVTSDMVYRITLDKIKSYPMKQWPKLANAGQRTYLSEVGLVIGQTARNNAGGILLVNDGMESATRILTDAHLAMAPESRMCVTSYRIGNQAYIGGAYMFQDGKRRFVRIPIDKSKPNGVDVGRMEVFLAGDDTGWWGYSCYVDQVNLRFWSAHGGSVYGFDLKSNKGLPPTAIPNAANHTVTSSFNITPTVRGSYAISGDTSGNLLSVANPAGAPADVAAWQTSYTFAAEPVSGLVFGSSRLKKFYLTAAECFSSAATCENGKKHFTFDVTPYGEIGPLSSVNDGTVVGIARAANSVVYLISLKDPKDPSEGLNFEKVKEVPGDAYMYTDFTGATMYAITNEKKISLRSEAGFDPNRPITELHMKWRAEGDLDAAPWRGLRMQIRCYDSSAATTPEYTTIENVAASEAAFIPALKACHSAKYDTIGLRVEGDGTTNAFSQVREVLFGIEQ